MGKFRVGSHANAKLTPTEVLEIREKYASGLYTQGHLAREYRVSANAIGRIVRGESWGDYRQPASQSEIEHLAAMASIAPLSPEAEADMRASEKRWLDRIAAEGGKKEDK